MNVIGARGGEVHTGVKIGNTLYTDCGTNTKSRVFQITEAAVTCDKCKKASS